MLQQIREKSSGWIAGIILGLVIITMAFFGIGDYFSPKIDSNAARIEGPAKFMGWGAESREISIDDFRRRYEAFRAQRREAEGEAFDSAGFDTLENKRRVLDVMVDEEIAALAAERDGITISDAQIVDQLKRDPKFQVGGVYSVDQYRLELASLGMTHAQYLAANRAQSARLALPREIVDTSFVGKAEIERLMQLSQQTRDLELIDLPTPSLPPEAPSAAELQAWYDSHAAQYRTEEMVAVEYVEIDTSALPPVSPADEATLRSTYESQKARYGSAPTRSVAHVLIAVPADADPAADAAARERAAAIVAEARAPGTDFAALVEAHSDDAGSKADGGNLGVVDAELFPGPELEALNEVGQISEPVRTTAGWHVLRLAEFTPGSQKSFEEVRAELEAEYMATEQERVFSELAGRLLEQIYKTPTALAPAAEFVGLPVQRTTLFSRGQGEGIAAIEAVRRAAFSDTQRLDRQVSDTIEIGPGHVVAIHVIEHKPEAPIPFADVQERVLNDYNADRLAKAAKAQAEALLARVEAGETMDAIATELGKTVTPLPAVGRQGPMPPDMVQAVFSAPAPAEGARSHGIASLAPDRFVLFAVSKVTPGDTAMLDDTTRGMISEQLASSRGIVEWQQYVRRLREYYTVTIHEDRL